MGNAYAKAFDNFRFSSGESLQVSSDAQNVDYGVGVSHVQFKVASVSGKDNGSGAVYVNDTAESKVSHFGSVTYPFGMTGKKKREKAVSTEVRKPPRGASYTNGPTMGVQAGGGKVGTASRPVDALLKTSGTLEGQNEIARPVFYFPQLG